MIRRISLASMVGCIAGWALMAPSGASGATTLGETFSPDSCAGNTTYIQTADPGNRYAVPFDGVITRWSYEAAPVDPATAVRLKVGSVPSGADLNLDTDVTIVAQSAIETPVQSLVNTYSTRIPVTAGQRIGEWLDGGDSGCSRSDDSFIDHYFNDADVQPGVTDMFTQENYQQDISAAVERDCDHDGLGDESQDPDVSSCATPASGTGQRAAAIKKCKKKAKKKHWSQKKLKKCKKKAKKLPV